MLRKRLHIEGNEITIPLEAADKLPLNLKLQLLHLVELTREIQQGEELGRKHNQRLPETVSRDELLKLEQEHKQECGPFIDLENNTGEIIGRACIHCPYEIHFHTTNPTPHQ